PLAKTGSLYMMKASRLLEVQRDLPLLNRSSLKLRLIMAEEGRRYFPSFNWYEDDFAVFEDHAGIASPSLVTEGLIGEATRLGARVMTNFEVAAFERSGDRITGVRSADGQTFQADRVVVCAGPRTPWFLQELGEPGISHNRTIQVNHFQRYAKPENDPFFIDG